MPILNLTNPVFISVDAAGRVNSNGTVGVYVADGLFTTLATVYADQVKPTELTSEEEATAEQLMKTRYQNRAWTFRGTRHNNSVIPS